MKSHGAFSGLYSLSVSKFFLKLQNAIKERNPVITYIGCFLLGFAVSSGKIAGGLSPFGPAVIAAVPKNKKLPASLGVIISHLLFLSSGGLKYLASDLIALSLCSVIYFFLKQKTADFIPPFIAFVSIAVSCGAYEYLGGLDLASVASVSAEAMLSAGCAYFFLRSFEAISLNVALSPLRDRVCLMISCCVILISLSEINLFSLSVGRILAALLILLSAFYYKETGGAVFGICGGAAIALATNELSFISFSLGGLIAGVFSIFGKSGTALSFLAVNSITVALLYSKISPVPIITEIIIASVIFILLPKSLPYVTGLFFASSKSVSDLNTVQNVAISKLQFASRALKNISETTESASKKLSELSFSEDVSKIFSSACDKICKNCIKNVSCWQLKYNETSTIMNRVIQEMRVSGIAVFPQRFSAYCKNPDALISEINKNFLSYSSNFNISKRVSLLRNSISDQFCGMSEMLDCLCSELTEINNPEPNVNEKIRELFEDKMLSPRATQCYSDKYGRLIIESEIPEHKLSKLDEKDVTFRICEITEKSMALPSIFPSVNGYSKLVFTESAKYSLVFASAQKNKNNNKFCGDSFRVINNSSGTAHIILADGMGSGKEAALSSNIAVGLMSRLIQSGFNTESALKLVNSALLVKSGDESLAAVDTVSFDLYSGETVFYKAGAAPSYIKRCEKIGKIESSSMPVGILGGAGFDKNSLTLNPGDLLLISSDGLPSDDDKWLDAQFSLYRGESLSDMAERICSQAASYNSPGSDDDVTVIVAALSQN